MTDGKPKAAKTGSPPTGKVAAKAMKARPSDLDKHKRVKKTLVAPLNAAMGDRLRPVDWARDRLPEHLWWHALVVIYGHGEAAARGRAVLDMLNPVVLETERPLHGMVSDFDLVPEPDRKGLAPKLRAAMGPGIEPFAAQVMLFKRHPMLWVFEDMGLKPSKQNEVDLNGQVVDLLPRRGRAATMVQFLAIAELARAGKLHVNVDDKETVEILTTYPNVEDHDKAAAFIGSMSKALLASKQSTRTWAREFWQQNRDRADCSLPRMEDSEDLAVLEAVRGADGLDKDDRKALDGLRARLRQYYGTALAKGIDQDLVEVVAGLAARVLRIAEDVAANSILRQGVWYNAAHRMMADASINVHYLLATGGDKARLFKSYGQGRLKLAHRKTRDMVSRVAEGLDEDAAKGLENAMDGLEKESNLEMWDQMVDIDLGDFEGRNTRARAIEAGQEELYHIFSTMSDSIHATWGAVRMQDMEFCRTPSHWGHWLPYRKVAKVAKDPALFALYMAHELVKTLEGTI